MSKYLQSRRVVLTVTTTKATMKVMMRMKITRVNVYLNPRLHERELKKMQSYLQTVSSCSRWKSKKHGRRLKKQRRRLSK